jgi:hypothetical protein
MNNIFIESFLTLTLMMRLMEEEQFYVMERFVLDRLIFPGSCSSSINNDNTNDAPNGGRAILRIGEVGLG